MNFLAKLFETAESIEKKENNNNEDIIPSEVEKPNIPLFPSFPKVILEKDDDEPEYRLLETGEEYVRAILGDFNFSIESIKQGRKQKYEIIKRNFNSNITHPGLIYYLGYCWGKEVGIVLRPDLFWSCILYELSKHIANTKDKYMDDFKELYRREKIVYDGYMTSYDLVDRFRSYIKYEEFYDMLTKERFSSEPKNFTEIKILSFCNFMRVEYKKHKMNCKIPKFQIKGEKDDWIKLMNLIDLLSHLIVNRFFIAYLENIKSLVANVVANRFQTILSEPSLRYQGIRQMIKDIFYIEKGTVKGWGRELYFDCYMNPSRKWELDDFNTHLSYIPYINARNKEAVLKCGGLCYSQMEKGCLEPMYGTVLCRINDIPLYKKMC